MNTNETKEPASFASSRKDNSNASVLIVDKDENSIRFMLEILARKGIHADLADDEKTALNYLEKSRFAIAFINSSITHNSADSFKFIKKIRASSLEMPLIIILEPNEKDLQKFAETAGNAVRAGCSDILTRPINREKFENLLDTFLPGYNIFNNLIEQELFPVCRIVGKSLKLTQTIDFAKKIAPTVAPVLVSGESGTGKELISLVIHHYSKRAQGPYVRINCAALSDSLLESELFGHEKGSFTGAFTQHKGKFEMAHGGTLLLDEVTETPLKFQAKLLRVLEQQDFERVGGNSNIKVDVRIISTTNKDLLQEVAQGRFRQDLYYRLSGVRLIVPPLRQRGEDLPDLVWHFVNIYAPQAGRCITKIDPAMMDIFSKYHWPGNIRQLKNVLMTSLILGSGPILSLADVSWLFDEMQPLAQQNNSAENQPVFSALVGMPLDQIERQVILKTLDHNGGNQTKAAKILGISDRTLRDKVKYYRQQETLQLV